MYCVSATRNLCGCAHGRSLAHVGNRAPVQRENALCQNSNCSSHESTSTPDASDVRQRTSHFRFRGFQDGFETRRAANLFAIARLSRTNASRIARILEERFAHPTALSLASTHTNPLGLMTGNGAAKVQTEITTAIAGK